MLFLHDERMLRVRQVRDLNVFTVGDLAVKQIDLRLCAVVRIPDAHARWEDRAAVFPVVVAARDDDVGVRFRSGQQQREIAHKRDRLRDEQKGERRRDEGLGNNAMAFQCFGRSSTFQAKTLLSFRQTNCMPCTVNRMMIAWIRNK